MKLALDRYRVVREMARNKVVLDVGCIDHSLQNREQSVWLHGELCKVAKTVTGIDYEDQDVAQLRSEGYDVVCGDAENFDLGRKFDLIVAGELLEHLPNPSGFLRCSRAHLGTDGVLLMTMPNAHGLYYFLTSLVFGREIDNPDHVCMYTPTTVSTMLRKCGFEAVQTMYISGFVPLGHRNVAARALAWTKNVLKLPLYLIRPALSHRFLVVARPFEVGKGGV